MQPMPRLVVHLERHLAQQPLPCSVQDTFLNASSAKHWRWRCMVQAYPAIASAARELLQVQCMQQQHDAAAHLPPGSGCSEAKKGLLPYSAPSPGPAAVGPVLSTYSLESGQYQPSSSHVRWT